MNETETNPALEAIWGIEVQQAVFRQLMDVTARPGVVRDLTQLLDNATAHRSVLATLLDNEVSLADPHQLMDRNEWPLLQVKQTDAEQADYILCDGRVAADFDPKPGTLSSPDYAATLIIVVATLGDGNKRLKLTGPGVNKDATLRVDGLHESWLLQREQWNAAFPLGVDMIFADANKIAALPRTTCVEVL